MITILKDIPICIFHYGLYCLILFSMDRPFITAFRANIHDPVFIGVCRTTLDAFR